jgi:hypothetical protein
MHVLYQSLLSLFDVSRSSLLLITRSNIIYCVLYIVYVFMYTYIMYTCMYSAYSYATMRAMSNYY